MKFIAEITVAKPFLKDQNNKIAYQIGLDIINPIKEATLYLDDTTYKFDYYEYFRKYINDKYTADQLSFEEARKAGKINVGSRSYYRIINE